MISALWPYGFALVVGAVIGSFLNVCLYRLPRHESVVWPSSRCSACARPIAWYDNIPIVSFLFLMGRCRLCDSPISFRYPMVELTNGIGYAAILWHFGYTWTSAVYAMFFSALLTAAWIDFDHQVIPDVITLPGVGIGMLCASSILPIGLMNSALGIVLGGGILWGLAWLSPYLFGQEGMGGGDVKLLAMIGAFLGWQHVLMTLMIAAVVGALMGIGLLLLKIMKRKQYMPFGPFLAFGAVITLLFHAQVMEWYLGFVGYIP